MPPVDLLAATQPGSNLQVILSSALDMTDEQKIICDDILHALSQANGAPLLGTEADREDKRKKLWTLVFENWNTNSYFHHPGTIPMKRLQHSAIVVGTFTQDHPPSAEAQKAANRKSSADTVVIPTTPPVRRAGQPVYIRPNVKMHEFSVVWQLTDGRGRIIQPEYFTYHPGITPESARADSMVHWDRNEAIRVCGFNRLLAVYWARRRLLRHAQQFPLRVRPSLTPNDSTARPVFDESVLKEEDLGELVKLRTCKSMMEAYGQLAVRAAQVAGTAGIGTFLI